MWFFLGAVAGFIAALFGLSKHLFQWDEMRRVLYDIADERKVAKGHGDHDIPPACTAHGAQTRARVVINTYDDHDDDWQASDDGRHLCPDCVIKRINAEVDGSDDDDDSDDA